jgi:molecular chaperone IbpA
MQYTNFDHNDFFEVARKFRSRQENPFWNLNYMLNVKEGPKYPPVDIIKDSETETRLVMAIAGMPKENIEISFKQGELEVKGTFNQEESNDTDYFSQEIAKRNFVRKFRMNEHMVVNKSKLKDGLLSIYLEMKLPEELKPKKISIE